MAHPQAGTPDADAMQFHDQRFEEFFAALYPVIRNAAHARINDWQQAEDLAEEVFTAAWRRRADAEVAFTAEWAFGALHNLVGNEYRRRGRAHRRTERLASKPPAATQLDRVDDGLLIRAAFARLTPPDQHLLAMAYWEDRTREQMADVLECSSGAVKTRLSRALGRLRRLLQETGDAR